MRLRAKELISTLGIPVAAWILFVLLLIWTAHRGPH